jgi:hypothetical protein
MTVVYTMERHHEVLRLWRSQDASMLRVVHLDFHCDMRGMLVDRRVHRAYRIKDRFPDLDQGNFLTHAVMERRVESVRWVHDEPGGRADDVGTVKLESDLSALPHRMSIARRGVEGIPIEFEIVVARDWDGIRTGEHLDIDWDHFACTEYEPESIPERIEAFFRSMGPHLPEAAYVCYSPEYSHPSRDLFGDFVRDLASRLDATIIALEARSEAPPAERSIKRLVPEPAYAAARRAYRGAVRVLRHRGVF